MWANAEPAPAPSAPRVTNAAEARGLVEGVLSLMADLEKLLEVETAHVRVGRIRDGLSQEARKTELTAGYVRALEGVKGNAVALARFAPEALERLKAAHAGFSRVVETNQMVLATARAVSESIVKGISDEMDRAARPNTYAPAGARPARPAGGSPLLVSRSF